MADAPDHYRALGLLPSARPHQIRKAYLDLARLLHPDHHTATTDAERALAERRMREINEAWAILGDAEARSRYDRELRMRRRPAAGATAAGRTHQVGSGLTATTPHEPAPVPGSFNRVGPSSAVHRPAPARATNTFGWVALAALVVALGTAGVVAVDAATSDDPPAAPTTTIPVPGG